MSTWYCEIASSGIVFAFTWPPGCPGVEHVRPDLEILEEEAPIVRRAGEVANAARGVRERQRPGRDGLPRVVRDPADDGGRGHALGRELTERDEPHESAENTKRPDELCHQDSPAGYEWNGMARAR